MRQTTRTGRSKASSGTRTRTSSPRATSLSTAIAGSSATPWPSGNEAFDGVDGRHLDRHLQRDAPLLKRLEHLRAIGRGDVMGHERLVAEITDPDFAPSREAVPLRDDEHQLIAIDHDRGKIRSAAGR